MSAAEEPTRRWRLAYRIALVGALAVPLVAVSVPASAATEKPFRNLRIYAESATAPRTVFWTAKLDTSGRVAERTSIRGPGGPLVPQDMLGGRLLFSTYQPSKQQSTIWIRNLGGAQHQVTQGYLAVFTPDGKSAVIERPVVDSKTGLEHSNLYLHRFSDSRETVIYIAHGDAHVNAMQVSADGKDLWLTAGPFSIRSDFPQEIARVRLSTHIVRRFILAQGSACDALSLRPDGNSLITSCYVRRTVAASHSQLLVFRLRDGKILGRHVEGSTSVMWFRGRLDPTHLLASVRGPAGTSLASVDPRTYAMTLIPNSRGLIHAVTEWD